MTMYLIKTKSILIKNIYLIGNLWKTLLRVYHMAIGLMVNRKGKLLAMITGGVYV